MIIKKKKSVINKIFSFKLFMAAGIFIIIFLGLNLGKEFYRKYQIQKEIDSLKEDIDSLEKNNYKMSQLIEYCKTDVYKETEIRKRLGVKKEGESVVMIKSNSADSELGKIEEVDNNENLPNYRKWWNYFFASK